MKNLVVDARKLEIHQKQVMLKNFGVSYCKLAQYKEHTEWLVEIEKTGSSKDLGQSSNRQERCNKTSLQNA